MMRIELSIVGYMLLLLIIACEPPDNSEAKAALIQERVEEKVQRLRDSKSDRCKEELYAQANELVDSILIVKAKESKDRLTKPLKANRPDLPDAFLLEDSFAIHPLLPTSDRLRLDTINSDTFPINN
jgi:hypothetical protein